MILLSKNDIYRFAKEKGLKVSYSQLYYRIKYDPGFPKPAQQKFFKKPRWALEDIEAWIESELKKQKEEQNG